MYLHWGLQPLVYILIYYFVPVHLRATCDLTYAVIFSSLFSYIENAWFTEGKTN